MTKHLYLCKYNNKPAYVLIGWDKNRKGFYMVFDYQNGNEENALYSNIFSKESYPKTLDKYIDFLQLKNIELPEQMIHDVLRDSFSGVSNKEVTHVVSDGHYSCFENIDYAIL